MADAAESVPVDAGGNPMRRVPAAAVMALVGAVLCFGATAAGALWLREAGGQPAIWPASAVLLAALLRTSGRRRAAVAIAGAAGMFAAAVAAGLAPAAGAGLTAAHLAEALFAFAGLRLLVRHPARLDTMADAGRMAGVAALLAPCVGASIAAAAATWTAPEADYWSAWGQWWAADAVGMLIVLPLACWTTAGELRAYQSAARLAETLFTLTAVAVLLWLVLTHGGALLSVLVLPALVWSALRIGRLGAAVAVVGTVAAVTGMTVGGLGPLAEAGAASMADRILYLQLVAAAVCAPKYVIAMVVASAARTKEDLQRTAAQVMRLYNETPVMLQSVGPDGRYLSVSDYWLAKMGYDRDEVIGRSAFDLMTPHSRELALTRYFPEALRTGRAMDVPYEYVTKSGRIMPVELSSAWDRNPDGSLSRSMAVMIDVSERQAWERALEAQRTELELIFNSVPARIFYKDDRNVVLRQNRLAAQSTGRPDLATPYDAGEAFPATAAVQHEADLEVIRSGEPKLGVIEEYRRADGASGWVRTDRVPYRDPNTGARRVLVVSTDVTQLIQAERDLKAQADSLARSNRDLERFAYLASHDLQEPLRMVASFTDLLARDYGDALDDRAREYIGFASDGARRMSAMIKDLLTYSRAASGAAVHDPVDLAEVLALAERNLAVAIEEAHARVEAEPLPTVLGNESQLVSLFQNVISNALKYRSEAAPVVRVDAKAEGGVWHVVVKDNGIGIDPKHHERVFDLFRRLHPRDAYEGTGLGLAICRKVVEAHGGTIWIESALGTGTEVHFTLSAGDGVRRQADGPGS
ncbi:MAG: ATP-binding protein [Alphaproteobacteria bacterium]